MEKYTSENYSDEELEKIEEEYYDIDFINIMKSLYILLYLYIYFPEIQSENSISFIIYKFYSVKKYINEYNLDLNIFIPYNFESCTCEIYYILYAFGKEIAEDDIFNNYELDPLKILLEENYIYKILAKYCKLQNKDILEIIERWKDL